MKKQPLILAIDAGTSSLKAAIMDLSYSILARAQQRYAYTVVDKVGAEMDLERVWRALAAVCNKFSPYRAQIDVITLCTFCPALSPMNRAGGVLCPAIIHLDRRTYTQARRAVKQVGKQRFLSITGNLPYPGGVSLTSLLWIKEHRPELFKRVYKFGHLNTFLLKRLTGKWLIDPTNASMTGLYETVQYGGWSSEMCEAFGITAASLPRVVDCDKRAGKLTQQSARALGLRAGTLLVMGGGDTACAAYGAGGGQEGHLLNIAGSSELITLTMKQPLPSSTYNLRSHVERGRWLAFTITVSGIAIEWFREQFCREMSKKSFYGNYLPGVLQGAETSARYIPHLCGDRFSFSLRKGAFDKLTLATTRDDMLRAMARGIMQPMVSMIRECEKKMPIESEVSLTGGAASTTLLEYKSRTLMKNYTIRMQKDCAFKGLAKLAGKHIA